MVEGSIFSLAVNGVCAPIALPRLMFLKMSRWDNAKN